MKYHNNALWCSESQSCSRMNQILGKRIAITAHSNSVFHLCISLSGLPLTCWSENSSLALCVSTSTTPGAHGGRCNINHRVWFRACVKHAWAASSWVLVIYIAGIRIGGRTKCCFTALMEEAGNMVYYSGGLSRKHSHAHTHTHMHNNKHIRTYTHNQIHTHTHTC